MRPGSIPGLLSGVTVVQPGRTPFPFSTLPVRVDAHPGRFERVSNGSWRSGFESQQSPLFLFRSGRAVVARQSRFLLLVCKVRWRTVSLQSWRMQGSIPCPLHSKLGLRSSAAALDLRIGILPSLSVTGCHCAQTLTQLLGGPPRPAPDPVDGSGPEPAEESGSVWGLIPGAPPAPSSPSRCRVDCPVSSQIID